MIINGAWYVDQVPDYIVVELQSRELKMFRLTPFREIASADLLQYKGHHPRKTNGQPLPEYLYRFYGLEKSTEIASEVIRVRVTPTEKERIKEKAGERTISDFARDRLLSD